MQRHNSIVLFVLFLFALILVHGQGDRTLTQGKCTLGRVSALRRLPISKKSQPSKLRGPKGAISYQTSTLIQPQRPRQLQTIFTNTIAG